MIAIVAILALAAVQLPAVVAAAVRCCCGEHAAEHDCGCADCPGGDHARRGPEGDADGAPSVRPCNAPSVDVIAANLHLAVAPPPMVWREQVFRAATRPPRSPAGRFAEPPPAPPPRVVGPCA